MSGKAHTRCSSAQCVHSIIHQIDERNLSVSSRGGMVGDLFHETLPSCGSTARIHPTSYSRTEDVATETDSQSGETCLDLAVRPPGDYRLQISKIHSRSRKQGNQSEINRDGEDRSLISCSSSSLSYEVVVVIYPFSHSAK